MTSLYGLIVEISRDVAIKCSYNAAYERILDRRPEGRGSVTVQRDDAGLRMFLLRRFEVRAGGDLIIDHAWHHRNAKALMACRASVSAVRSALTRILWRNGWQNTVPMPTRRIPAAARRR